MIALAAADDRLVVPPKSENWRTMWLHRFSVQLSILSARAPFFEGEM
jgi:hypothetical protein